MSKSPSQPWVQPTNETGEHSLKAPSLGALRGTEGKKFKGFTSMDKYRKGIIRALKYLRSAKGTTVSNKIMTACAFSGDQHRAVLDFLLEKSFLKERANYKRGQARYEAGPKLEGSEMRKQL